MINEMLFEHETPSLDDIEKGLFEWLGIHSKPGFKNIDAFYLFNFIIDLFIGVNLSIHK